MEYGKKTVAVKFKQSSEGVNSSYFIDIAENTSENYEGESSLFFYFIKCSLLCCTVLAPLGSMCTTLKSIGRDISAVKCNHNVNILAFEINKLKMHVL